MNTFEQQKAKIRTQPGFIAALDQSGGSIARLEEGTARNAATEMWPRRSRAGA